MQQSLLSFFLLVVLSSTCRSSSAQLIVETVPFSPTARIDSFDSLSESLSWRIIASYTPPSYDIGSTTTEEGVIHVPILYFPSPGVAHLDAGAHPCVVSMGPCCLLDFAEQYTSIEFFRYIDSVVDRTTCAEMDDARGLVRGIFDRGLVDLMVTQSLAGIDDVSITLDRDSSTQYFTADIRIPHLAMKTLLSSPISEDRLQTFVGIMWLRTRPVSSFTYGLEVVVSQPSVTLTLVGQFLDLASVQSYKSDCVMTPQGICMFCENPIDPNAYYIYTEEGMSSGVCEFRCNAGYVYSTEDLQCRTCSEPSCPEVRIMN